VTTLVNGVRGSGLCSFGLVRCCNAHDVCFGMACTVHAILPYHTLCLARHRLGPHSIQLRVVASDDTGCVATATCGLSFDDCERQFVACMQGVCSAPSLPPADRAPCREHAAAFSNLTKQYHLRNISNTTGILD
jgi:hypothetical protein